MFPDDIERLYAAMKERLIQREGFATKLDRGVTATFATHGQTAGLLTLSATEGGVPTAVHAIAVFLAGLDDQDDRAALTAARGKDVLRSIARDDFEKPLSKPRPYAAAYFTCQESMDDPYLYDVLKAAYAAFFDRLGMGA